MEYIPWVFSGVGITILLFIGNYVRKHYLHVRFEPVVMVDGYDSHTIELQVYQSHNIEALVAAAVKREDNRLPSYNHSNLNPYANPWLMTPSAQIQISNQRHYMTQKALYLNTYRTYQFNLIQEKEGDRSMVAIPLYLCNKGKTQGNNIEIEISLKGMFYDESCKVERQATRNGEPQNIGNNNVAIMMPQMNNVNYKYHYWNLQNPISSPLRFTIDHLNPQGSGSEPFVVIYANTNTPQNLMIHYKVLESTLETPVESDIRISVL